MELSHKRLAQVGPLEGLSHGTVVVVNEGEDLVFKLI
jgi:hypothetical protein